MSRDSQVGSGRSESGFKPTAAAAVFPGQVRLSMKDGVGVGEGMQVRLLTAAVLLYDPHELSKSRNEWLQ